MKEEGDVGLFKHDIAQGGNWNYDAFSDFCGTLLRISSHNDETKQICINELSLLRDRRYRIGQMKRNWLLAMIDHTLAKIFWPP